MSGSRAVARQTGIVPARCRNPSGKLFLERLFDAACRFARPRGRRRRWRDRRFGNNQRGLCSESLLIRKAHHAGASTQRLARKVDEMLMMGEKQDLRFPAQLGQQPEPRRGALVIEIDEQVVRHEGKRIRALICGRPLWQGLFYQDGFDRLLSYVRPVCAAFLLPLALMEIRR